MISTDSLKNLAEHSTKTLKHLHFKNDDTLTFIYQSEGETKEFPTQFRFDPSVCELILGLESRRVRENKLPRSKLEIMYVLYIDDKILIYEAFDNPKGYRSHALVREN